MKADMQVRSRERAINKDISRARYPLNVVDKMILYTLLFPRPKTPVMKKVNIGGDPNDSAYRYKREMIQVEKATKGMRQISNWNNICKQLKVGSKFTEKFHAEIKRRGNPVFNNGCFRGNITAVELEKILVKMIDTYLLCPKCKLPEWNGSSCSACGETKTQKVKEMNDDDGIECNHVQDAVKIVKDLYILHSLGNKEADEIIDWFWKLPICTDRLIDGSPAESKISDKQCEKVYKKFCENYETYRNSKADQNMAN